MREANCAGAGGCAVGGEGPDGTFAEVECVTTDGRASSLPGLAESRHGLGAVVVGAGMQRITGMGFALVAAPFLVLLLGPVEGVVLVNVCGAVTAGAIIFRVARDIDWKRYAGLTASAVLGIVPAAFLIRLIPPAVLEISIGVILAVGLTVLLALKSATLPPRRRYLLTAGGLSGFMNTAAGVGGPAVSIARRVSNVRPASFR